MMSSRAQQLTNGEKRCKQMENKAKAKKAWLCAFHLILSVLN
uniref:Uncharacterized protein n=1 Tax=Arundo donax TaxID=35708 RepID=A0A0A9PYZ9_ARUDO